MATTVSEINCFESFKLQVNMLAKYLDKLEGIEFQRSCNLLENVFKPRIEKSKEMQCKPNGTKMVECQLKDLTDSGKQLAMSNPQISNFDAEQTLTEKFLNSVPDESFLPDNILMHNSILEENKTDTQNKDNCFGKNMQNSNNKFSQSISVVSEDPIKYSSPQYEIAFKDQSPHTYLDLSHKSNFSFAVQPPKVVCHTSVPEESNVENNSEIILNLCSKNKPLSLKDGNKNLQNESSISEEFDNLSYHISTSNLLLGERLLERNDSNSSNPDLNALSSTKLQANSKDDFTKIFNTNFNGSTSVIHSTNAFKEEKKLFPINSEYHSYISEVEDSLSLNNETPKVFFKTSSSNESPSNPIMLENHETEIRINCDTDTILNLKKEPVCITKENSRIKNNSSQDSSCNSLNLGLYSIFNSLNSLDKNKDNETPENCVKALNLVNKKYKKVNSAAESLKQNSSTSSGKNNFTDLEIHSLNVLEKNRDTSQLTTKEIKCSPVSCRKCQVEIADVTLWIEHEKTCGMNLFCTHCDIHFKSKVIYYKHMTSHKRNTCTHCPSTFSRHQLLRAHMKNDHGINLVSKTFPCQHCPRIFMKRSSIYYHLQSHALPNQKVCPKCGKFMESDAAFEEHMEEHVKNASLQCHICNAIFQRYQQYNDHMEGHKRHVCVYCEQDISFSSKKSLFKHYKTEHPNLPQKVVLNKKYSCDQCPRVFTRPSLLKDHTLTHTDLKHLECRLCNMKYSQRSSLKKHLKNVHSQNAAATDDKTKTRHFCQQCGFVCTSLVLLNKHSVSAHNMTVSHACSYCDYKTKHRHLLKRHMDTHLEKKKYLCDICGSLFHSSSTLKHHTIFLHSNERSYKCKQCDKSFKNKSCLSRHNRTHSNERPYKCECGSCYKQLSHLSRHLSSAHNKKLSTRKIKKVGLVTEKDKGETTTNEKSGDSSLCYSQTVAAATNTDSSSAVSEVVERSSSDILLASGSAVLMTEGTVTPDPAPLFTVLDSQLIHLIPSMLQLHQEGIHTVSLVNGELHPLSIASPAYQISQGESFNASASSDTLMINSSQNEADDALGLEDMQTENSNNELSEGGGKMGLDTPTEDAVDQKSNENSQLTLGGGHHHHDLPFASNSLQELQYRENDDDDDDNETIPSLPSSHYLTQQDSSLHQEIGNNNISIF